MPNPNTTNEVPEELEILEPDSPVSLRESLDAAIDLHEEGSDDTSAANDTAPPGTTPAEGASAPSPAPAPAASAPSAPPAAPTGEQPAGMPPAADDQMARAPGSWTAVAREKWNNVDREVRAEIWRREKEVSRAMTQSTNARRFEQEFGQMVQPYLGFIAAERSTPLQAAQNMMQTAATLRVGTDQQKVALVADIIKNYKVDLQALDSVLAGQTPEFNPQVQIEQIVNQRIQAAMGQQQQSWQQRQQQSVMRDAETTITQFAADPKNEFYEDVRHIMGDLIAGASQRGEQMELSDAYSRAILIHEPVRRVIEGRRAQTEAATRSAAAQRARRASGGVVPSAAATGGNNTAPADDSIRAALEFAIDQQQGR